MDSLLVGATDSDASDEAARTARSGSLDLGDLSGGQIDAGGIRESDLMLAERLGFEPSGVFELAPSGLQDDEGDDFRRVSRPGRGPGLGDFGESQGGGVVECFLGSGSILAFQRANGKSETALQRANGRREG
ncbi:hypothetical protein [Pseudarthrobacter siccitolerans]|uniref:hypothetical protein n=1 Tax=Pseudarthrobacter siccitolerans TaxID=861266 RepID=UPI00067912AE|nr:hypothetical protein [Pseudarthrobacter siccitolerans]